MNINKEKESKDKPSFNSNDKEALWIPLGREKLLLNKHHSVEPTGNKSPDTLKTRKSRTLIPNKNEESSANNLVPVLRKNIIEWTEHGKLIVLFATNLFWANQMVNCAMVIEDIGLQFKNDELSLANIYKLYSIYYFKDEDMKNAIKSWNSALNLFRKWQSIHGAALCYLLKAFLQYENDHQESIIYSNNEDDSSKSKSINDDTFKMFDKKMKLLKDEKQITNLNKIKDAIISFYKYERRSILLHINAFSKIFISPIFSTEDEVEEEFSPKVINGNRHSQQKHRGTRYKVKLIIIFHITILVKTSRKFKKN